MTGEGDPKGQGGVEQTRGEDTRHLCIDHVSLTGIGGELDIPERGVVRCKGQGGAEEEGEDSSHCWSRRERRPTTANAAALVGYIYFRLIGQAVRRWWTGLTDSSVIPNPFETHRLGNRLPHLL
jgi:hypothetical protein